MKTLAFFLFIFINTFFQTVYADKLVFGVEKIDYMPFYNTHKNQFTGYARELFDQFAKDNGHSIEYKSLPVARLLHELFYQRIDFKFPDNPHWKKDEKKDYKLSYSLAVVDYVDGVMVKTADLDKDESYFTHIGTVRGFTPWPLMQAINEEKIQISEYNSIKGLLNKVILGRINGCYINIDVAKHALEHHLNQENSLVFNKKLPHDTGAYFLSTISRTDILQQFNQWLTTHQAFLQQLKEKWAL